jgi:hypothetical protein
MLYHKGTTAFLSISEANDGGCFETASLHDGLFLPDLPSPKSSDHRHHFCRLVPPLHSLRPKATIMSLRTPFRHPSARAEVQGDFKVRVAAAHKAEHEEIASEVVEARLAAITEGRSVFVGKSLSGSPSKISRRSFMHAICKSFCVHALRLELTSTQWISRRPCHPNRRRSGYLRLHR